VDPDLATAPLPYDQGYRLRFSGVIGVDDLDAVSGSAWARLDGQDMELFGMADGEVFRDVFKLMSMGDTREVVEGDEVLMVGTLGSAFIVGAEPVLRFRRAETDVPQHVLAQLAERRGEPMMFAGTTLYEVDLDLRLGDVTRVCAVAAPTGRGRISACPRWEGTWEDGDPVDLAVEVELTTDPDVLADLGGGRACHCYDRAGAVIDCEPHAIASQVDCDAIPPRDCVGNAEYCAELVHFDPPLGPGYVDLPVHDETWENQYRSWVRRDLGMLIRHAAATVHCASRDWPGGNGAPLVLAEASEDDGNTPGTRVGELAHPPGSHSWGNDIDVGYYQTALYPDNGIRAICYHYEHGREALRCTRAPHALDARRTALFTAIVAAHPRTRCIGVDGMVGPLLREAQAGLLAEGVITAEQYEAHKLCFETEDMKLGWYRSHHHHVHVSTY